MSLLDNIKNLINKRSAAPYAEDSNAPLSNSDSGFRVMVGFPGVRVNEKTALKLSAFYDGVNTISDDLAQLPISIYRKTANGREEMPEHPADFLISAEPNDEITSFLWRKSMYATALMRGNHYTRIHRDSISGEISHLEPLETWDVHPFQYQKQTWYKIKGVPSAVHSSEIIHIKNFSLDGKCGKGVIEYAAESMGISLSVQQYGKEYFQNGSMPTGVLSTEQTVKLSDKKTIRESWNKNYSGSGPKGVAVLDAGMQYQHIYLTPEQTQFISSRKFSVVDIARWLKIPPHKLKDLEKSAFSNIEQQNIDYVQSCLMAWVVQTEQELVKKLFTISEKQVKIYVKINVGALLRGDVSSRWQSYKDGYFTGALSPNDIRRMEDLNPRDGGDEYMTPVNMQTFQQIQEQIKNSRDEK